MLHSLWMCLIGLVAGALAKLIMPGKGGLLRNKLVLITSDELRIRFDLLAGQLERARDEVKRLSSSTPIP